VVEKLRDETKQKLIRYIELLKEKNKFVNLVSFDESEFLLEVAVDSLIPWYIGTINDSKELKVIDIGTGAGIPGIPLAMVLKNSYFHLVDSKRKKADFVDLVIKSLELENVSMHCKRIEEFSLSNLETFDLAVSRAVGETAVLLEYAGPILKINAKLVLYKGSEVEKELSRAKKAIEIMGFSEPEIIQYNLEGKKNRTLLVFRKIKKTSEKFPRKPGMATKKPLI